MTTHNETINFLILQGWEYDPNMPDGQVFRLYNVDLDWEDREWYTIQEALDIEKMNNPDEFREFELLDSLDNRYLTMVSNYMDS
jgi:hypothetical protein